MLYNIYRVEYYIIYLEFKDTIPSMKLSYSVTVQSCVIL